MFLESLWPILTRKFKMLYKTEFLFWLLLVEMRQGRASWNCYSNTVLEKLSMFADMLSLLMLNTSLSIIGSQILNQPKAHCFISAPKSSKNSFTKETWALYLQLMLTDSLLTPKKARSKYTNQPNRPIKKPIMLSKDNTKDLRFHKKLNLKKPNPRPNSYDPIDIYHSYLHKEYLSNIKTK